MSDSGIVRSVNRVPVGSRGFSAGIPEEECVLVGEVDRKFRALVTGNGSDKKSFSPEVRISKEEIGHSGDGQGKRGKSGGSHGDDSYGHKIQIGDYYSEIEIESCRLASTRKLRQIFTEDTERAEEYYGRAILVSPGDGEILSLYAQLIWDRHGDKTRTSMVLGSYAHFMWEAEEEDNEEDETETIEFSILAMNNRRLFCIEASFGHSTSVYNLLGEWYLQFADSI
ncbi:Detected protein of unknown function [Hibiscus syriacus]|uniref:Uncharacterized protein n=1 Tax=Hibiscus syriacus TaxID=106335 RepID=A0A6A3CE76_HIBSY|nr:Detected protein of unknown function [Hibiscus syriacus]